MKTLRGFTAKVSWSALLCAGLLACGRSKPKSTPASAPVPYQEDRDVKAVVGPTASQPAELLQESVARILGFVDIYGKNVQLYQDAYSALYDNLARQEAAPAGSIADPLFYYSPVFIPSVPQVVMLGSGELSVKITNIASAKYVRTKIATKLAQTLKDYKIVADRVNILPLESASGKLKAFGREYNVTVERDFSVVSVIIPRTDIPPKIREEILKDADGVIDSEALLQSFTQLPLTYTYYVQRYREQDCHFNIDDSYINKMYSSSKCADPSDKTAATDPTTKVDAAFAAQGTTKADGTTAATFPGAQKSQVQALVAAAKAPITACMAGEERSNLQARASVKCTKPAKGGEAKTPEGFDAQILDFLQNSVKPAMTTGRINPTDPNSWDSQMVAAAIRLFGDPEKFRSELTKFNEEINNAVEEGREINTATQTKDFVDKISEFGQMTDNQIGGSKSNSVNVGMGVSAFSGAFGNGNASSNFERAMKEIVDKLQETNSSERLQKAQEIFKKYGMDHTINELGGKIYFYPSINVAVKADVERIRKSAGQYVTNELGDIVIEKRETSAALNRRNDLAIEFLAFCTMPGASSATPVPIKEYIDQVEWWKDTQAGSVWDNLNKKFKDRLTAPAKSCSSIVIQSFYSNVVGNESLTPEFLRLGLHGGAAANKLSTPALPAVAAGGVLDLKRSNNSPEAYAQSTNLTLDGGRAFDDVKLLGD